MTPGGPQFGADYQVLGAQRERQVHQRQVNEAVEPRYHALAN
jgi:hypothetical protein